MGITIADIQLDNPSKTFKPGDTVTGNVVVHADRCVKLTEAKLTPGLSLSPHKHDVQNDEAYKQQLLANDRGLDIIPPNTADSRGTLLEAGKYSYPFEFQIKPEVPYSFSGGGLRAAHRLELTMKAMTMNSATSLPARRKSNDVFRYTEFQVAPVVDLNDFPSFKNPSSIRLTSDQNSFWFNKGNNRNSVKFDVIKTGFLPGEDIPFELTISNESSRKSVVVNLQLIQQVNFAGKLTWNWMTGVNGPVVSAGTKLPWNGVLKVPEDIWPTSVETRKESGSKNTLMGVDYYLKVHLGLSKSSAVSAEIPIVIGTIPFKQEV